MTIKIINNVIDASKFKGTMDEYTRQLNKAVLRTATYTVNQMAIRIQQAEKQATLTIFDQPVVRFTSTAMMYTKTQNAQTTPATVSVQKNRLHYFTLEEFGGTRLPSSNKARGKSVIAPEKVKLNQYGNIPRNKVKRLLANRKKYFIGKPANKAKVERANQTYGLYERTGTGKERHLKLLIRFPKRTKYRKKFQFYGTAYRTFRGSERWLTMQFGKGVVG